MKKIITIIYSFLIIFFTNGCFPNEPWVFSQDEKNIVEMQIIFAEENRGSPILVDIEVLAIVATSHFSDLISEFYNISYSRYLGDPHFVGSGYGIKVIFENGDFDLLTSTAPLRIRNVNGELSVGSELVQCSFDEFTVFIEKWLSLSNSAQ